MCQERKQFSLSLQLPKATETTALSGAGFMRLVKNVGQSISKIASKKSETDSVSVCVCVCVMCVDYVYPPSLCVPLSLSPSLSVVR